MRIAYFNTFCFCLQFFFCTDSKGKRKSIQQNGKEPIKKEQDDGEENENEEDEDDENTSLSNMKYEDPGAFIMDDESDDSESEEKFKQVHGLSCALLQIAQSIDVKYFKPPYGNLKSGGKHGTKEENAEKAQRALERWQVSLMNCRNASQLFLHYNVLYDAIKWTRSAQNAKCSCRSSKDPDKLLLCDGCNIGRHIYCLKPKLTVCHNVFFFNFCHSIRFFVYIKKNVNVFLSLQKVPEGDWFCNRCKPNQEPPPQKKKRQAFTYSEDEEDENDAEEDEEEDEEEDGDEEEDAEESDESTLDSTFEDSP